MPRRVYTSPFTGDAWPDIRPAIGTIAGLANYFNEKRPRRKPLDGHDAAIALATDAAGAIAGIPKIVRTGEVEGRRISDAYWQAKEAKARLTVFVDERFLHSHQFRGEGRLRAIAGGYQQPDPDPGPSMRAARLAWYAAALTEKAAAGGLPEMDTLSYGHDAALGAVMEVEEGGVDREDAVRVERVWRFVVAAGRMPKSPQDDDVLAAFEAAIMVGEHEFAENLAKHGYGFKGV